MLANLPKTIDDARKTLDFLEKLLVKNSHDITIMSEPRTYRLLTNEKKKPIQTMFELGADFKHVQEFKRKITALWK